jgi:hypothetical protein
MDMTAASLAPFLMHSREEFQTWLARDLEVRDELYALMGREPSPGIDSLDELEAFLLGRFPGPAAAVALEHRGITDAAARHVGLVFVLNVDDAVWDIELDNEAALFYRLPVIRFADDAQECPLTMTTAALDRRTGDYLRTIIESYRDDYCSTSR